MKIFLTGGTGFAGAHTARALLDAGHDLRLLVRNVEAARSYYAAHGHPITDFVQADMRDAAAIREGMRGCEAVLHGAAMVSLDPRKAKETYKNNVEGMRAVVGTACDMGVDNIVYVSSLSVLMQTGFKVIDETTPLANTREAYSRSKRDCDEYARGLQAQGHPIQITYPSAIIGPDDPRFSEANHGVSRFLAQMIPNTASGFQCVDVRDLAQVHRYLLEHPVTGDFENARYVIGGHYYPWQELRKLLEGVAGRRLRSPPVPGLLLRLLGELTDLIKKVIPFETQVTGEAMGYVTQWVPADSGKYLNHSGQSFRPGEETFSDTIRWMMNAGYLQAGHAPRLAAGE